MPSPATDVQVWPISTPRRDPAKANLSARDVRILRFLPSLTDLVFACPLILLFVVLPGTAFFLKDGDTGWHIRTGEWILQHHRVPTTDIFSFSKSGEPWFAWEWGWDVAAALIHRLAGLAGVAVTNALLLSALAVALFRWLRSNTNDAVALVVTVLVLLASLLHWSARPHLVSWLFLLLLLRSLNRFERTGLVRALYPLPVLLLLWANLHGGFVLGLLVLAIATAGRFLESFDVWRISSWRSGFTAALPLLIVLGVSALATLVNPYGWHLHQHIASYLSDPGEMNNIQEFQSIDFHESQARFFEALLLLAGAAMVRCLPQRRYGEALLLVVTGHFALVSARNIPLFAVAAAYPIARLADECLQAVLRRYPALRRSEWRESWSHFRTFEQYERVYWPSLAIVIWMAASVALQNVGFRSEFDPKQFPAAALPRIHAGERVFTYDQWADYFIYERTPLFRSFFDGRSDFFGAPMIAEYQHIMAARWDSLALLDRQRIDAVLIKPVEPLASLLKQRPEWRMSLDNGRQILFERRR